MSADSSLNVSDIVRIVKECRKNGVTSFSFWGMKVEFGLPKDVVPNSNARVERQLSFPKISPQLIETQNKQDKETIEQLELTVKEEYIDGLMIENPAEYEKYMEMGELVTEKESASGR